MLLLLCCDCLPEAATENVEVFYNNYSRGGLRGRRSKAEDGVEAYQTITELREGQLKEKKKKSIARSGIESQPDAKSNNHDRKRKLKAEKTTREGEKKEKCSDEENVLDCFVCRWQTECGTCSELDSTMVLQNC